MNAKVKGAGEAIGLTENETAFHGYRMNLKVLMRV